MFQKFVRRLRSSHYSRRLKSAATFLSCVEAEGTECGFTIKSVSTSTESNLYRSVSRFPENRPACMSSSLSPSGHTWPQVPALQDTTNRCVHRDLDRPPAWLQSPFVSFGSCEGPVKQCLSLALPWKTQFQGPHLFSVYFLSLSDRSFFFTSLNHRLTQVFFNHGPWLSLEWIQSIHVFASSLMSPSC